MKTITDLIPNVTDHIADHIADLAAFVSAIQGALVELGDDCPEAAHMLRLAADELAQVEDSIFSASCFLETCESTSND